MRKQPDEVFLAKGVLRWPVELAEEILAKPLPWGPPTYGLGIYIDDPTLPDQSDTFFDLAASVNGYERQSSLGASHRGEYKSRWLLHTHFDTGLVRYRLFLLSRRALL